MNIRWWWSPLCGTVSIPAITSDLARSVWLSLFSLILFSYSRLRIYYSWYSCIRLCTGVEQILQVPLCLAVEDLWRVKIRARLGEDAQYWYAHLKIDQKTFSKSHTRHFHIFTPCHSFPQTGSYFLRNQTCIVFKKYLKEKHQQTQKGTTGWHGLSECAGLTTWAWLSSFSGDHADLWQYHDWHQWCMNMFTKTMIRRQSWYIDNSLYFSGLTQLWCTGLQCSLWAISRCQSLPDSPWSFRQWSPREQKFRGQPQLQVLKTFQLKTLEATRLEVKIQWSSTRKRLRPDPDHTMVVFNPSIWKSFQLALHYIYGICAEGTKRDILIQFWGQFC